MFATPIFSIGGGGIAPLQQQIYWLIKLICFSGFQGRRSILDGGGGGQE